MKTNNFSLTVILFVLLFSTAAFAADSDRVMPRLNPGPSINPCTDLIKECMGLKDIKKERCLYSTSKHYFCEGSQVATLLKRRVALSPAAETEQSNAADPAQPSLVNNSCLQNFDNHFSSKIINGNTSPEVFREFSAELDNCLLQTNPNITRP